MPTPVIMPKFEMAQETGTVARWLKQEGDRVAKGDALLEVETDKVTMEVEATAAGIMGTILAEPGQVVPIGQPIAYILGPNEQAALAPSAPAAAAPQAPSAAPAAPYRATPLAERMASAHGVDLSAIAGTGPQGRVTKQDVENLLARQPAEAPAQGTQDGDGLGGKVRAVPAARRLARELDVDLRRVTGTGPAGRIQSVDVQRVAAERTVMAPPVLPPEAVAPAAAVPSVAQPVAPAGMPAVRRVVPLTNVRRTIAERMTASTREAPQFTLSVDVDMTRAQGIVEDLRAAESKDGPRITLTSYMVRACAWALAQYPAANAAFDAGQIIEWDDINIGVAVAAEQGLLVPVIHNTGTMGVRDIAARLADLSARAREGRLRLEDIQGGTFTVSNLGMFGIDRFEAILNPPQAAILAVGRVANRPVAIDAERIKVLPMASLTLTADHRVLDGAGAAQFLSLIQKVLEHPGILLS